MKKKRIVIALGHNALGETLPMQKKATVEAAKAIADLIQKDYQVVVTHSNGPQVGMIHTAMAEFYRLYPEYTSTPMSVCSAMSQGYIGYDLQNAIRTELLNRGVYKTVSTVLTQVTVDPYDDAFYAPTKVIGRVMTKDEAEAEEKKGNHGVEVEEGYRRIVAAPKPMEIIELDAVKALLDADQIVVAAGMENLLFLLRQILGEKVSIGIENPVYKNAYEILKELDFKIHPISMDESGMCVEQLQKTDANLAYVTPAHQYPTGVIMPIGRRSQLLGWAKKDPDHYIIEDDYDSEFRYHGKPIPAMQGLDDGENVIYMGTFSKAIAPAIRASYMVLPKKLAKRYQQIGQTFSCAVSRIDQKVLTLFMTEGHFERHLNRMRNIYKEKHDLLIKEIKKLNSDIQIYGHGAGAHIIVRFPVSDQKEFQKKLRQKGVMIYPLSWYYIEGKPLKEEYILGFTRMKKEDMIRGIEIIGEVLYSK